MTTDVQAEVTNLLDAFAHLTSAEKADMARRQPDFYGPLERLAAGAKFVLTYAE